MHPIIEPSVDLMSQHLQHLFGGWLDGLHDALIEIAWTNPQGNLNHARLFGTDQLEEAAEFACAQNKIPQQNVYVGAALRKADCSRDARAKDENIIALTAFYTDLDEGNAAASAKQRYRGCPPTCAVITGRQPHTRVQLWWRLETPERDLALCRSQNIALAETFGGDRVVVNPSRVMRLAGSIAWPHKPGRIIEKTELQLFDDGRPQHYMPGQLQKIFPLIEAQKPSVPTQPLQLNIGGHDPLSVEACLIRIKSGEQWHNNMLRLCGHWIVRGWSDAEIITASESLTLPGYTAAQTRAEVSRMVAGARRKWNIQNPSHKTTEIEPVLRPPLIDPTKWAGKEIPQREWVIENWIPMNYVTALYGDGGLGKTLLAQQLLTSIATGREWLGLSVKKMKAFGLLCEDNESDLHLNQDRINNKYWLTYADLSDLRLWSSVGFDNLLMQFDGGEAATGKLTAFFEELMQEIKKFGARFVVIDTVADTFGGNENNRNQVRQFVANACGRIAREIDGSVLVCAHPSLTGLNTGTGTSGSTAWNNTVRSRLFISADKPPEGDEADPDIRVLTRKKSNYARAGEVLKIRWVDGAFMVVDKTDEPEIDSAVINGILDEIDRAWNEGTPYSDFPQAKQRYISNLLPKRLNISRSQFERAMDKIYQSGFLRTEMFNKNTKAKGLKVVKPPVKPPD